VSSLSRHGHQLVSSLHLQQEPNLLLRKLAMNMYARNTPSLNSSFFSYQYTKEQLVEQDIGI
jgi:hypothetical protein